MVVASVKLYLGTRSMIFITKCAGKYPKEKAGSLAKQHGEHTLELCKCRVGFIIWVKTTGTPRHDGVHIYNKYFIQEYII